MVETSLAEYQLRCCCDGDTQNTHISHLPYGENLRMRRISNGKGDRGLCVVGQRYGKSERKRGRWGESQDVIRTLMCKTGECKKWHVRLRVFRDFLCKEVLLKYTATLYYMIIRVYSNMANWGGTHSSARKETARERKILHLVLLVCVIIMREGTEMARIHDAF